MQYHIVLDIERSADDGDLESRLRHRGLEFNFVYAPLPHWRESEWSRWTQILPAYLQAARTTLTGMGQQDHLIFLTATGLAFTAATLCSFSSKKTPKISVLNFIYRRRFWPVGHLLDLFVKRALEQMKFIGVPSRMAAKEYSLHFPKAVSRIHVFPTWCGFPENTPVATPASAPIFSGGRSMRDYGTLLETLRQLKASAIIAASRTAVDEQVIPENIRLYCDVPEQVFADLMMQASIVVVPLQPVDFDAGQSVVLQAMCYGKPVIATNTAGLTEYIDHGKTGLLVPPSDPSALASAIKSLLDDSALASAIGTEARRVYQQRYSRDEFVKRLASTFRSDSAEK
jgi:glycosyltransferase involved in cell wall biosynthesis